MAALEQVRSVLRSNSDALVGRALRVVVVSVARAREWGER